MNTTFMHHVQYSNTFDPAQFEPFIVAGEHVGYLHHSHIPYLISSPLFLQTSDGIILTPDLKTPEERTQALFPFCEHLYKQGIIKKWRGEEFVVSKHFGAPELMRMERESTKFFGIMNYGVALNGWVSLEDGTRKMWIATRSFKKSKYPGKLDNIVNGGFTAGYTAWDILVKESMEEAGDRPTVDQKSIFRRICLLQVHAQKRGSSDHCLCL